MLLGAFQAAGTQALFPRWVGLVGAIGVLLNAIYWVWTIQRVFWGQFSLRHPAWKSALHDLTPREYLLLIPSLHTLL